MKVHCPQCRGTFRVEGHSTGTSFECPYCHEQFSFRDKQTVVVTSSPESPVQVELEPATPERAPERAEAPERAPADPETSSHDESTPSPPPPPDRDPDAVDRPTLPTPPPRHCESTPSIEELTDLRVGDVIAGYRLEEVIGSGGMSVVFRALQLSLSRPVALKVLRKDLGRDAEFAERFRNEAHALAELGHPNIVSVYDQGTHEGSYYLVMEFVDGVSLRDVLSERRLRPAEALKIVPSLCNALEYAHSRGIVHRDIKPENILIDRDGAPRIADFGLVRILGDEAESGTRLTKTQTVLGTIDYMAPEQREGLRDIDHRADIYSLGVVLYEMLTGELPIARFPRPSERTDCDVRLDDVVLKVLEKDRDRRYQRASMVATDIAQIRSAGGGKRGRPAPTEPDPLPETYAGRLFSLLTSFSFIFVTTCVVALIAFNEREEGFVCAVVGAAIPYYLGRFVLSGLLPRPVVSPRNFFRNHPVVAFGAFALLAFLLMVNVHPYDAPPFSFAIGLCASSALCVWTWRNRVFRNSSADPLFVPWGGTPEGYEQWRDRSLPRSARRLGRNAAVRARVMAGGAAQAVREGAGRVREHKRERSERRRERRAARAAHTAEMHSSAPPPPYEERAPAPPQSTAASSSESTSDHEEVAAPPLRPFSAATILAFIISLPVLLWAAACMIAVHGFDLASIPLMLPDVRFHEYDQMFRTLWQAPLDTIGGAAHFVSFLPLLPALLPFILLFFAVPGIASRKRRGVGFFVLTGLLWLATLLSLVSVTRAIQYTSGTYIRTVRDVRSSQSRSELIESSLREAADTYSPEQRIALLHRAYRLSLAADAPLSARGYLVRMVNDSALLVGERTAALLLLDHLYPGNLFEDSECYEEPRGWIQRLRRSAEDYGLPRPIREGCQVLLDHNPRVGL